MTLSDLTDIALCAADISRSFVAPGPVRLPDGLGPDVEALRARCEEFNQTHPHLDEFSIEYGDVPWRVHRDPHVVNGLWYRLRRGPNTTPTFDTLTSALPAPIVSVLLHKDLNAGGLVLVTGAPGAGKTTTASAAVVGRLTEHGGIAYTIERPPEHKLHGWHGSGVCTQTYVSAEGWAHSLVGALRSQPAGMPSILFVGEIRDDDAAVVALKAASSGFLVIATAFGHSIPTAVENFLKMITPQRAGVLSTLLKVVVYQKVVDRMVSASALVNPDPSCATSAVIRGGRLEALEGFVTAQRNVTVSGGDLWKEALKC